MANIYEGIDNPFQDWRATDNPEWSTVRKQQWPFVAQYLRRTNPHAHLKFYRGGGKLQYSGREAPDSEFLVGLTLIFSDSERRDRVLRIMGEPGRPANDEDLGANDIDDFHAVDPLLDCVKALGVDRVLFMTQELNEESITKFQEFHTGKPVETPNLDNPVYQQSRKWFGS